MNQLADHPIFVENSYFVQSKLYIDWSYEDDLTSVYIKTEISDQVQNTKTLFLLPLITKLNPRVINTFKIVVLLLDYHNVLITWRLVANSLQQ